ncbi:2'-5' RNA ligase family protein [Angustibacter luteus]
MGVRAGNLGQDQTVTNGPDDGVQRTIGVAISIPDPYGEELRAHRASFGDPLASSIPTHVTLLPPTELDRPEASVVTEHLSSVAAKATPFEIHLRGTSTFRPVSPVVFVPLVQGIGGCEVLEQAVRSGPLARDLQFYYHPHVTIAHHLADDALDRAARELADFECRFVVDGFHLYEHGADGVWRPQGWFPFPGSSG